MTIAEPALSWSKSFELPGTPAKVFAALTDGEALKRWFAEHAEVEPRIGGAYRFWGRHTMWAATRRDANQVITHCEVPNRLVFTWTWAGCSSRVDMRLSAAGDNTKLAIEHVFDRKLDHPEAGGIVRDFWTVAIGNLASYLKTGHAAVMPDYLDSAAEVELSIFIEAPPEVVWQALIDPKLLNQWFAKAATVEPRAGGAYSYGWTQERDGKSNACGPARIIELVPNHRLVHDWHYDDADNTRVTWELMPEGSGTRVSLRHVGFAGRPNEPYRQGWAHACVALRALAERLRAPTSMGA